MIVAPTTDLHARAVSQVLSSHFDTPAVIWDSGSIPAEEALCLHLTGDYVDLEIKGRDGNIALDSLRSVWWRRPGTFRIDAAVTDHKVRQFCVRECSALFRGTLDATDVPIVNDPTAQDVAARKPVQLRMAQRVGLTIPKTLMSNDPDEVRSFWEALDGHCIYKAFTAPSEQLAETRTLAPEDLKHLVQLRHAPMILQEKIEKGLDVRVNVFGESVFAASVTINRPEANLDWRLDLTSTWQEHGLPDGVAKQLTQLLRQLGLQYGCIDLRQRPDGAYVFLEVNPAGQFLFIEVETGQPLARALAELLVRPRLW